MDKIISALNKAITKAGGAVNNAILENALKSLGWHVRPPMMWQPEETAPVNEHVLTFDKLESIDVAMKFTDGDWALTADYTGLAGSDWKPTHWMPLPEQPK